MTDRWGELGIELQGGSDIDEEELAGLTSRLRVELLDLDLDVDSVEPVVAGEVPAGSKGVGLLAVGGVLVRFALRSDVLQHLVAGVRSWLGRQRIRSVKLILDGDTCEVTGLSSADQERLIDLWIARHADPG